MQNTLFRAVKNIGALSASNLVSRFLSLLLLSSLARNAGADGVGGYAIAQAWSAYVLFAADFGLAPRLVREASAHPDTTENEYQQSIGAKCFTPLAAAALLAYPAFVSDYAPWVKELTIVMGVASLVVSFCYINDAISRSRERMEYEALGLFLRASVFVGGSIFAIEMGYSLLGIGYAYLASAFLHLVVSSYFARRFIRLGIVRPSWAIFRSALPFAATSLTTLAFVQIDVLLLSLITSQEIVGQYASVSRLLLVASFISVFVGTGMLPTATRIYASGRLALFSGTFGGGISLMVVVAGALVLVIITGAEAFLRIVYGSAFADLTPLLQLGAIFLLFRFVNSLVEVMLTAAGRQGHRARAMVVGLASTVLLLLVLTPWLGLLGAILTLIGSEAVLFACLVGWAWDLVPKRRISQAGAIVTGGLCLNAALWLLWIEPWLGWLGAPIPIVVYLAIVTAFGETSRAIGLVRSLKG